MKKTSKTIRTLSKKDKFRIAYRDGFTCQFCGSQPGYDEIEIDHLVPVSKGGSDDEANLIATCKKCNRGKSDLVMFPENMTEGRCRLDADWVVHKSFGEWQVKYHPTDNDMQPVLEFTPFGYWFELSRAHEPDWWWHVTSKGWTEPHKDSDFYLALAYFRRLARHDEGPRTEITITDLEEA